MVKFAHGTVYGICYGINIGANDEDKYLGLPGADHNQKSEWIQWYSLA